MTAKTNSFVIASQHSRQRRSNLRASLVAAALCALAPGARAETSAPGLFVALYTPDSVVFDGDVDDWAGAGYKQLLLDGASVVEGKEGWSGDDDMWVKVYLAYDDASLRVGMAANDDKVARSKKFEKDEDHVELWIGLPPAAGGAVEWKAISYYPGRTFPTFKGGVRWGGAGKGAGKPVPGAKLYEEIEKEGWEAELVIPWKSMPDVYARLPETRWALVAVDCDNYHKRTRESVLATGWEDGAPAGAAVRLEGVENLASAFLKTVGMEGKPATRFYADLAEDGRAEVVMQAGTSLGVFGLGYKESSGYEYVTLPADGPAAIASFELTDVTGDRKADMVVRYRQTVGKMQRAVLAIYNVDAIGGQLQRSFAQELERTEAGGSGSVKAEILPGALKGQTLIKITPGEVKGWTQESAPDPKQYDMEWLLLPWMEEKVRYYLFKDGGFEKADAAAVEKTLALGKGKKGNKK